ncbi:MAG: hypothetical protein H7Z13_05545 [Ferruginibacter sp.]|nr:hypothetical protein [Ferruginibacter sp.]
MNNPVTDTEKLAFKKRLRDKCIALIEQRIVAAANAVTNAQAAANAEEKSSAGDKYETSRAMSHLEKDMQARQLAANREELQALSTIACLSLYDSATAGSFIQCELCSFFIAAGLGKINFEGRDIYLISPNAPVAKALFNKKQGSVISFNKKEMVIMVIF